MLRSFDHLRGDAKSGATIASDDERLVVRGGGDAYATPWHWHDCLMLILPAKGALDLRFEQNPEGVWLTEDRFALIPADGAHESRALRDSQSHVAVYVTEEALRRVEAEAGSLARVRREARGTALFQMTPEIRALLNLCRSEGGTGFGDAATRGHLSSALLIRCLAEIERGRALSGGSPHGHGAALVREVQAHLAARLAQDVPLDEVAERFGLSRRHLTRSFRQHTGQTIGDFLQSQRLAAARRLLVETDLPVGEVAFRVGFDSGSSLARALRRVHDIAPGDLRQERDPSAMARSVAR